MKILQVLKTLITVKGLEVLLLGKEVTSPDGVSLGMVVDIKKELAQDRIWMVIDNLGHERIILIEQIAGVVNEVILVDDSSSAKLAVNKG